MLTREASLESVLVGNKMSWAASLTNHPYLRQSLRPSRHLWHQYASLIKKPLHLPELHSEESETILHTNYKQKQLKWMSRKTGRPHVFCFINTTSKVVTDCSPDRAKQACSACVNYYMQPACSVFSAAHSKSTPSTPTSVKVSPNMAPNRASSAYP